jgi:hypothetical protein
MSDIDKNKIKPIYAALQSYLREAPKGEGAISEAPVWEQYNNTIDELNIITGSNYSKFRVILSSDDGGYRTTGRVEYRQKLAGLISCLHAEYLSDEQSPFNSNPSPSMVVNQRQSQQQTMTVTLFEIRDKIDQRLSQTTDEKEKTFLQKLKEQLPTVLSVMQLIQLILHTAQQAGVDINTVKTLLA